MMKKFCLPLLAAASLAAAAIPCGAQTYPSNPVKIVLPYPPGGGTDIFARVIGPKMGEVLGTTFVVENRPGASGQIAGNVVGRQAPADGYTMLLGDMTTYAVNPSLYKNMQYDPQKDLAPVTLTARFSFLLVVNPSVLPVSNVKELVAASKKTPSGLNYASPGNGTPHHLITELFARRTDAKLVAVLYKGGGPAVQDLVAGQVSMMFLDQATALPFIKSGKLRAIATASDARLAGFPDVPTVAESGVPGFNASVWQGFAVRTGTSPAIIDRLVAAYRTALQDATVKQRLADLGIDPVGSSPQQFGEVIRAETTRWADVIRQSNIVAEQ